MELQVTKEQYGGKDSYNVKEGNSKHTETCLPGGEASRVFRLVTARVATVQVAQVIHRITLEAETGPFFSRKTGQHLVEDVVILLVRQRPNNSRLVEEIAVDFRAVKCAICHLNLDEMTLKAKDKFWINYLQMS